MHVIVQFLQLREILRYVKGVACIEAHPMAHRKCQRNRHQKQRNLISSASELLPNNANFSPDPNSEAVELAKVMTLVLASGSKTVAVGA